MMSRQKKAGAISALFVGSLMLAILLASANAHGSAVALQQTATITPTPCDEEDQLDCEDDQTATAEIYFENQTATALVTTPGTVTITATTGTGTATATNTLLPSPTTSTVIVTPVPSPQPATPIAPAQQLAPTETPTEIPDDALTCYPGQPLVISGDGPPRAAYLVYFGQRVVSGGSVAPSGRFATTLLIGRERAGVYPIIVRVRGTSQVLLELSCAVPDVTPTFVPRARTLP
jgi:hypothetical protein